MNCLNVLIVHVLIYLTLAGNAYTIDYCNYSVGVYQHCGCNDFKTFAEVDHSNCHQTPYLYRLSFRPASGTNIILDGEILPLLQYFTDKGTLVAELWLYDLAGIDLRILREFDLLYVPIEMFVSRVLYFRFVHLDFSLYLDGERLQLSFDKNAPPGSRCNESLFVNMFNTKTNIFNLNYQDVHLANLQLFSSNLCPFVFQNMYSLMMTVYGYPFQFDTTEYSNLDALNATFQTFKIFYTYKLNLNNATLHPILYGRTMTELMFLKCSVDKIQVDLFKSFQKLRALFLYLNNMRDFFYTNGFDWAHYLNSGLNSTEFDNPKKSSYFWLKMQANEIDDYLFQRKFFPYYEFTYSDQDYCLFENYPHKRLVAALIFTGRPINCSCTLFSLVKQYPYYRNANIMSESDYVTSIWTCFKSNLTWIGEKDCNISCNYSKILFDYQGHYFDLFDLKNQFEALKKFALVILGPVACVLGFISNLLVIFTIKSAARVARKRSKGAKKNDKKHALIEPKQPFFVYMLVNAVINLISSILYFLYFIIKCDIQNNDGGSVANYCFIETLSVNILASILKLLSNFTFLQMSVNRYALVGRDHFLFLINFANIKIRKYVIWGIVISSALSVVIYFQQRFFSSALNDNRVFADSYYYIDYLWYGYDITNVKKIMAYNTTVIKLTQLPYLSGFSMVHDLFSYFIFCILTTVVDAMTVVRLKRVLDEKNKLSVASKDRSDEIEKSEKKSIAMVVLNSLAIFILRSPELIAVVFFYNLLLNQNSDYTFKMFCYSYRQCLAVLDLSNIFYLFSLSLNFVFYYLFNISFKVTFIEAVDLLRKFLKRISIS